MRAAWAVRRKGRPSRQPCDVALPADRRHLGIRLQSPMARDSGLRNGPGTPTRLCPLIIALSPPASWLIGIIPSAFRNLVDGIRDKGHGARDSGFGIPNPS